MNGEAAARLAAPVLRRKPVQLPIMAVVPAAPAPMFASTAARLLAARLRPPSSAEAVVGLLMSYCVGDLVGVADELGVDRADVEAWQRVCGAAGAWREHGLQELARQVAL